jgi:hypothetical protein
MTNINHRQIWQNNFGSIPIDEYGRSYEIHHINGNHFDNSIENLKCVSIDEHFQIHLSQGDFGACFLIARRMGLSSEELSNLQKGNKLSEITKAKISIAHKRGHFEGKIKSWNEGFKGYKLKLKIQRKGKRFSSKISEEDVIKIKNDFIEWKKTQPNKLPFKLSHEKAFARLIKPKFPLLKTDVTIVNILKGKSWKPEILNINPI